MAEQLEKPANPGEEITNPPSSIPLRPEEQFRLINQRIDNLADQVSRIAAPPQFRLADVIQLGIIVIGFFVAILGAFNLSERIGDLRSDQAAMERRVNDNTNAAEARISPKLDKLNDLYVAIVERISRLEGAKSPETK